MKPAYMPADAVPVTTTRQWLKKYITTAWWLKVKLILMILDKLHFFFSCFPISYVIIYQGSVKNNQQVGLGPFLLMFRARDGCN